MSEYPAARARACYWFDNSLGFRVRVILMDGLGLWLSSGNLLVMG